MFLWCHVRHLNPLKNHPERITQSDKEFAKKLDYNSITIPVTIKQITQIERQNNININVFGYETKSVYPIRISKERYQDHMELLYFEEEEENGLKQHYVYIKDFNRLMCSFTKHQHKNIFACIVYNAFIQILT